MATNPYLANQLNGPVINAIVTGIQNAMQEDLPLITYWTTLDIANAQDVDGTLNYVGTLVGYPRPLATDIFFETNLILFQDSGASPDITYIASTVSFSAPNIISDSANGLLAAGFTRGGSVRVSQPASAFVDDFIGSVIAVAAGSMLISGSTLVNYVAGSSIAIVQGIPSAGLDDANNPFVGPPLGSLVLSAGQFDNALPLASNIMPAVWYQKLLPIFAQAVYLGLSLQAVDTIAGWANLNGGGTGYTITRNQWNNINVTFKTSINVQALYIANSIVQEIETLPLVVYQEP